MTKIRKDKIHDENDTYVLDDIMHFKLHGRASDTYAQVSLDKWPIVSKYTWYLGKAGYPLCYSLGKMTLHKFVYPLIDSNYIKGSYIDHFDRNKLNNTDMNLRIATPQQNAFNKTSTTNTKGVKKISESNYTASIVRDGKKHEIKNISTLSEAAEIYNYMAEELFGEFAAYNNVENIKPLINN
jgi:hypothetical protein